MAILYTENLIPIMTSKTTPSGIVSASSEYSNGAYDSWKAFNHDNTAESDAWLTLSGTTSGWLCYKFTSVKRIQKYTVIPENVPSYSAQTAPKNWTFEGSNDGSNWVILDTRINETNWINNQKREYIFKNYNSYLYYRINITANNGYTGWLAIGELEMMEATIWDKFLIKQNSNYYTIKSTNYDSTTSHSFTQLTLTGGTIPNKSDVETFGFDDLVILTNNMSVGTDTFIPVNKFDNTAELKLYKA